MDKHEALPHWRRWKARHRLVYEIDDDVFRVDVTNWMAYSTYKAPAIRDALGHAAEVADIVTVTTEPLAEIMREFNPEVRVIPNVIPDGVLGIERCHQPKVVIGWAGGASHARDLALVAGSLRHVIDRHGKRAEIHLYGTNYARDDRPPGPVHAVDPHRRVARLLPGGRLRHRAGAADGHEVRYVQVQFEGD